MPLLISPIRPNPPGAFLSFPFVVGPAVERKMGTSAFTQSRSLATIDATAWKDANWAREKGLYTDLYETFEELDQAVEKLNYNHLTQTNNTVV